MTKTHLSNIFDHRAPRARETFTGYSYEEWLEGYSGIERAWQRHLDWIKENEIGPPKATEKYSQKELENMGLIGVYLKDKE